MTIRIIVNGAGGKMGKIACEALEGHSAFSIVARCYRHDDLGATIRETNADVVIDLTEPSCVFANALTILEHNARPVIGTSGLTDAQIHQLDQYCQQHQRGAIIAPNFSIGVALLVLCAQQVAQFFPACEIIERHHPQKKDAPSGTAIKTASVISQARKSAPDFIRQGNTQALGLVHENIPIHAIRLPGIIADETVLFGNTGETLSLEHKTLSRDAFKPGILLTCQRVMLLDHLVYGLEHLL